MRYKFIVLLVIIFILAIINSRNIYAICEVSSNTYLPNMTGGAAWKYASVTAPVKTLSLIYVPYSSTQLDTISRYEDNDFVLQNANDNGIRCVDKLPAASCSNFDGPGHETECLAAYGRSGSGGYTSCFYINPEEGLYFCRDETACKTYASHQIRFKISEAKSAISKIKVKVVATATLPGVSMGLYAWNFSSSSYESIGVATCAGGTCTPQEIAATLTEINDYVNSSGDLYLLVTKTDLTGSTLSLYYAEANVSIGSVEPEVCNDLVDNDCDGNTDCADSDCSTDPACQLTQVIIVDETITSKCVGTNCISDTVIFDNIIRGTVYNTGLPVKGNPNPPPAPFLIVNEGSSPADVKVYSSETQLFSSPNSYVKFSIYDTIILPSSYADPWSKLDNCWYIPTSTNVCWTSTPCGTSIGGCVLPFGQDNAVYAVRGLKSIDATDEAIMNIRIYPAYDEPSSSGKSTTISIIGSSA